MRYDGIGHNNGVCVSGVYSITNTVNGKMYIGLTVDMYDRWRCHARLAGKINKPLYNAIAKYGIDNFDFQILEECYDRDLLPLLEMKYVAEYNTTSPNGYNLTIGGEGVVLATEEQRKAASDRMLACWQDDEYREAQIAALNTNEHKSRQAEDSRKRWQDPDYKEKVRQAMLVVTNTPEHKEKLSAAQKLLWSTEEHRTKMAECRAVPTAEALEIKSQFMTTLWNDPEFKEAQVAKIRAAAARPEVKAAQKAGLNRPEVREKISKSHKARWKQPQTIIKMFFRKLTCGVTPSFEVGWARVVAKGVNPDEWYEWARSYYDSKYPQPSPELASSEHAALP